MSNTIHNIISDKFAAKYKNKQPQWGFNGLGYVVYKRTYARNKPDGTKEEWWETVQRCVNGAQKIGAGYTQEEAERLYDYVFNLKGNFAGRMLWQLGTPTVDRWGANSLLNCWAVAMREPRAFLFLFENLMLGGGVGFSIRREDVHELPKIKSGVKIEHQSTKDADFIVPDSREGWVKLLSEVLDAYYVTGKSFTYSSILIRGKGEPIKGFGGTSSGPGILIEGIEKICTIFDGRVGKKLRSIDVLDICNIIGSIVVAGNVRRSAEIALGDPDDFLYLRAKNWADGNIPNWRDKSNNTIYADSFSHISEEVWEGGYVIDPQTGMAKGEPYGFFNLPLSQKYGRLADGPMKDSKMYPTQSDDCEMTNPCLTGDSILTISANEDGSEPFNLKMDEICHMYKLGVWPVIYVKTFKDDQVTWKRITFAVKTRDVKELIEIETESGRKIRCTPEHQIQTKNRGWIMAKDLVENDELIEN
jgi:adenosylcobalamin-dependent ribonucleoside-triphosphate reductase